VCQHILNPSESDSALAVLAADQYLDILSGAELDRFNCHPLCILNRPHKRIVAKIGMPEKRSDRERRKLEITLLSCLSLSHLGTQQFFDRLLAFGIKSLKWLIICRDKSFKA